MILAAKSAVAVALCMVLRESWGVLLAQTAQVLSCADWLSLEPAQHAHLLKCSITEALARICAHATNGMTN